MPADAAKHSPKIINFISQSKNPQIEGLKKIRAHSGAVTDTRWDAHSYSVVDISILVLIIVPIFYDEVVNKKSVVVLIIRLLAYGLKIPCY